jgi:uncharacterized protein Yka (UPF0111/DUF47 family)
MSEEELRLDIMEINGKIDRIIDSVEAVKERCEEISSSVAQIKKAVYEPDEGLYARIRELEQWKENTSKILWVVTTSIIGLASATVWSNFF